MTTTRTVDIMRADGIVVSPIDDRSGAVTGGGGGFRAGTGSMMGASSQRPGSAGLLGATASDDLGIVAAGIRGRLGSAGIGSNNSTVVVSRRSPMTPDLLPPTSPSADNYLTGRKLIIQKGQPTGGGGDHAAAAAPSQQARYHTNSSNVPLVPAAASTPAASRQGQVTAAARACSGELVAVPQLGAHRGNLSGTHPLVDGGAEYDHAFIYRGNVEPTARSMTQMQDAALTGQLDGEQAEAARKAHLVRTVVLAQAAVRRYIARRRYLMHCVLLRAHTERVFEERSHRCARLIQKCARRMLCQHRYLRMRDVLWTKGQGKRKQSGKTGNANSSSAAAGAGARAVAARRSSTDKLTSAAAAAGGQPLPVSFPWRDGLVDRNLTFVIAVRALWAQRLEEALHTFESFSQMCGTPGGDKVALRLVHCIELRLRSLAAHAAGADTSSQQKGDKKGAGGAKGGGANAKGKGAPPKRR